MKNSTFENVKDDFEHFKNIKMNVSLLEPFDRGCIIRSRINIIKI